MFRKRINLNVNDLRFICYKTKSGIKAYEDLNFFQKILYKIRLKRFFRKNYKPLVVNQLIQEKLEREDLSYNEYLQKYFKEN